nr:hypothetical protein [Tanacetum cinerariifolium]
MRERNQDRLAIVANHHMTPPHFNTYQSSYNNPQLQQQFPPSQYGSIHPDQHYSSTYPSQPQFNHSSIPPSYPYQSQMNHQTSSVSQITYQSPQVTTQPMTESSLVDLGLAVLIFSPGDDLIACLNKAMAFLTLVASLRVTVQQVQGRQGKSYSGEGHMARQCTQPKRPRNAEWYKDKVMLVEAQETGQILDEEKLAFLADPRVPNGQVVQIIILNNDAFQTEDLDTYDFDCDDVSNAKAVLMTNISNYGSYVISEVPHSETYLNDMENQKKANKEQNNESVIAKLERYKERAKTFEQRLNIDLGSRKKMIDSQMDDMIKEKLALKEQVNLLEQNLSKQINEKESLLQTFTVLKMHMLTKPQIFYDNIHKQALGYQNPFYLKKAQRIKPTLYDGIVISNKHVAMPVIDDEETLILEKDFRKRFVLQQELSADKALWYHMLNPSTKSSDALPVKIEAPKELFKVSLVNESLKKLKLHLTNFDKVVKINTTPNARTEGEYGFKHTKAVFNNEIIPFLKSLKDIFNVFDKDLLNKTMEVQTAFDQMEAVVQQCSVDKQCFEIAKK